MILRPMLGDIGAPVEHPDIEVLPAVEPVPLPVTVPEPAPETAPEVAPERDPVPA